MTPKHKPLVIKGCRQCGKTFSATAFAEANYEYVVGINFIEQPELCRAFEGSLKIDDIIMYLSTMLDINTRFVPGRTCIILDEIQECPQARTALKFFCIDGRYDVIATGSLLGVSGYNEDKPVSIPIGYETQIDMYPLDFEEFLWANGISEEVFQLLRHNLENRIPVPTPIHLRMKELLLRYLIVGGMPEAVNIYLDTKQMNQVLLAQRGIVNGYRDDMLKYAPKELKSKIRESFDSIPKQLRREYKKFQYSIVRTGATSARYAGAVQWIEDAAIIRRAYNVSITELPLDGNAIDSEYKVYMADIGLLISMLEDETQADILMGNLHTYKGAIFENLMADFLGKSGKKLYYYHKETGLEVDFLLRIQGECVLVECKAQTGNAKSAKTILKHPEKYHVRHAIKLGDYNIGQEGPMLTLPLYLGFMLPSVKFEE